MDYINSIMEKYPPFETKEEEDEMINRYLKNNDIDGMRNELVLRNVGIIRLYSKPWNSLYTHDECASFGIEGLIRAAKSFNHKLGIRFSTYACYAIRSFLKLRKESIRSALDERSISMDARFVSNDSRDESISDIIDRKVSEEYRVVKPTSRYIGKRDTVSFVFSLLKDIGCSEKEIHMFHSVIIEGMTQVDVGKMFHVSKERVRQIINRVSMKLKKNIGKVSRKLLHRDAPKMDDFITTVSYNSFSNGKLVTKSKQTDIRWNDYYYSVKFSNHNCLKKLKEIIMDGIPK